MTTVTSLLPAAAFAVRGCMRSREPRWMVLLALVTAAVAAGGDQESAVHVGIACAILLLLPTSTTHPTRHPELAIVAGGLLSRVVRPLIAAVDGLALSAPAWLPVIEQALLSVRAASLASTPHLPLNPLMTWLFLNPNGFGNPVHGNWNWLYNYSI